MRLECLKEVLQELLLSGEQGGAEARAVAVGPRLLQRGGHPLPAAGAAAVPHASFSATAARPIIHKGPSGSNVFKQDEEERVVPPHPTRTARRTRPRVWICVKRVWWVDRHGRRKSDTWVYAYWGITPRWVDWVKETYRETVRDRDELSADEPVPDSDDDEEVQRAVPVRGDQACC